MSLLAAGLWGSAAANDTVLPSRPQIEVKRHEGGFDVIANAEVNAEPRVVWDTLTDYERLPQFIPGIRATKVLERRPLNGGLQERVLVEQQGEVRFLFFTQKVAIRLDVLHAMPQRIEAKNAPLPVADGAVPDISAFEGRYVLEPTGKGTRLLYRARIVPAFDMPPLIGTWAMRETMAQQFGAMLSEIERRAALSRVN